MSKTSEKLLSRFKIGIQSGVFPLLVREVPSGTFWLICGNSDGSGAAWFVPGRTCALHLTTG